MIHIAPFEFAREYPYNHPQYYYSRTNGSEYKMTLNGKASVMVEPDIAIVTLGVETQNKELKVAQEENAVKSTQVINALIKMGIAEKDIKTESYTINPEYDYVEGKQIFRDYKVTHTFRVTIKDLQKFGEIIDAAVSGGANIVTNINFTVSNPSEDYNRALNLAVEDAIKKAKAIEEKLGIVVNKVPISITEESQSYIPVDGKHFATFSAAPAYPTPIKEGQIEINATIKAIFIYWVKTP